MNFRIYSMITLAIVLGFYISFNFALNLYSLTSPNLSFEVTEQNTGGTFSSLSRNFDQTIDNINDDENSTGTTNDEISTGTTNDDEISTGTTNDETLQEQLMMMRLYRNN